MSAPQAKRGCRPLVAGETTQVGDFIWFASQWQPVESFHDSVGKVYGTDTTYRHCRPVAKKGGAK